MINSYSLNIIDYKKNYQETYNKHIIFYFILLSIFIVGLIFITFNFDYYTYYNGTFILESENTYSIFVNSFDIEKVTTNNILIKDGIKYQYKIKEVNNPVFSDNGYYQKVIIILNVHNNNNIKIFNAQIIISKKKIFWYIVEYLKGV